MITLRFHLTSPFSGEIGFSGVPLRAAFLDFLRECNGELSERVHGAEGTRAYSIDPFPCDAKFNTHFEAGQEYVFCVHLFKPSAYQDVISNIALKNGHSLRLHHHRFPMNRIDFLRRAPHSMMQEWTDFLNDIEEGLIRLRFNFLTPTQLSEFGSDKASLLPTPEKVFTSLLRVWNTMENATKLERTGMFRDWVTKNVYVSGYYLRTVRVPLGRGRTVIGFIGNVVYNIEPDDSPLVNLTTGLARYAEICNIGKNRSAGFGKVEVDILNKSDNKGNRNAQARGDYYVLPTGRDSEKTTAKISKTFA
ncbi:MAG: CRISPR system precrRNA processing endoribonuclease RAMP protein Cas6 [Candidatus Thorarchaeota archaeon]|nr:CRISPR system precrRNA processing endoribonuclease RAMP protein Cas6 [Candidatus Thorarchaeota archaeon]